MTIQNTNRTPVRPLLEPWVGVKEVAVHLGVTERWVRSYAQEIPHARPGKAYRFKLSEVEDWVERWRSAGSDPMSRGIKW